MKKIFKSILLISIMFYFGCDDNPSKPSNEIKNPFSNLSGSKDGYLISTIMKSYDKEGLNFTNHSKQDYYFYDSIGEAVLPNDIKINNGAISHYKNTSLPYDGSDYSWDVTGNQNVSTFNFTIDGIVNSSLISPIPDTTIIDKTVGLTINYNNFVGTNDVLVHIKDNAYLSKRYLDSSITYDNEIFYNYYSTTNTGQFTITPSMLSHINGNRYIDVRIIGFNELDTLLGARNYKFVNGAGIRLTYEVN